MPTCTIAQTFTFEAAHSLPNVPDGHRCKRLHGHSYRVDLSVTGEVDERAGWVIDFYDIEAAFAPTLAMLDHYTLNDVPGLENPTAERIAIWIWDRTKPLIAGLSEVAVFEVAGSVARFTGSPS